MTTPANPAEKSTESSTEVEQPPTPTTPEESDTRTALGRSSAMRAVGAWSNGAGRSLRRIQG